MRILFLSPYPPFPPRSGGALRIYNLIRGLSKQHEVWCLTFAINDEEQAALQPLRAFCEVVTVRGLLSRSLVRRAFTTVASPLPDMALRNAAPAFSAALRTLLESQHFDVVQAASIEMGGYGLQARKAPGQPLLVFDEFNAEYVFQRRAAFTDLRRAMTDRVPRALIGGAYSLVQWQKLAAYERRLLQEYDHVLAVSQEDRDALRRLYGKGQIEVVPNGVDTNYFDRSSVVAQPELSPISLVFTGTLNFRPNIDAVLWFANDVLPLIQEQQPDVQFVIVGKSPAPAIAALDDGKQIRVYSDVPDVRPFIVGGRVYVVPMRMGGGVRLKVLEALSMQAPVVATSMGVEGIEGGIASEHFLLADEPRLFAQQIARLIHDTELAQRIGNAGRQLAQERYDWEVIVPILERMYETARIAKDPVSSGESK